jgi:hypothetical protein
MQSGANQHLKLLWLNVRNRGQTGRHFHWCPPALRECGHRGLARRRLVVRRRAIFVLSEGKRPHPRRCYWRGVGLEDSADDDTNGENVEVVVIPLAGWARLRINC